MRTILRLTTVSEETYFRFDKLPIRRYTKVMVKLLEEAIEKARLPPADRQIEAARMLLSVVEQDASGHPRLTDEQEAEVRNRMADRHYATDEEVSAFFRHTGA